MTFKLLWILFPLAVGMSAYVYAAILTAPGMILEGLNQWVYARVPEWLYMPLIGCQKCAAGQWALWLYMYLWACEGTRYHLLEHLYLVLASIFSTIIFEKIHLSR